MVEAVSLPVAEGVSGTGVGSDQFLTFELSGEIYGVSLARVREIIGLGTMTRIPMMPEFIAGVVNLRGNVLPVIDLAHRLGFPSSQRTKRSSIVIIELEGEMTMALGMIVDAVHDVLEFDVSALEPAPAFGAQIRTDFIAGMARRNDDFLVVLEPGRVLNAEELTVVADASTAGW